MHEIGEDSHSVGCQCARPVINHHDDDDSDDDDDDDDSDDDNRTWPVLYHSGEVARSDNRWQGGSS